MANNSPRAFNEIPATPRDWQRWFQQAFRHNYTVATLPDATTSEGDVIYVSDESGGATLAFSTGTEWRRVQDRAVVS